MQKIISKKYSLFLLCSVVLVAVMAYAGGTTYGRYVHQESSSGVVVAKEFYFTSDYLEPEGANYTLNPGTEEITFQLQNYADAPSSAEDDIAYTVTTTGGTLSEGSGNIAKGDCNRANITLNGLAAGQSYTVTATGKAGYQETLSATFTVAPAEAVVYKYLEQTNAYVLLTVWTENVSGKATVTFPDGLIPDNTDVAMVNVKNYSEGHYIGTMFNDADSFSATYSTHTYRFFKEDTTINYTVDDFTVTVTLDDFTVMVANLGTP